VVGFHMISGESDYLLEVVVPDLAHYKRFLLEKLLSNPIIREVRSNIAIQTLKAGAPLPLGHLTPERAGRQQK
jgi:Lrp/AsnC family transcriptional regulator, leucine-responsive regulatory protein